MNTLRRMSSIKPKGTRHTVTISRSEGSLGLGLSDDNCVTSITPGSSAAATDVLVGDYVVGIGGKPVGSRKLVSVLAENAGIEIVLEIERASAEIDAERLVQRCPYLLEALSSVFSTRLVTDAMEITQVEQVR